MFQHIFACQRNNPNAHRYLSVPGIQKSAMLIKICIFLAALVFNQASLSYSTDGCSLPQIIARRSLQPFCVLFLSIRWKQNGHELLDSHCSLCGHYFYCCSSKQVLFCFYQGYRNSRSSRNRANLPRVVKLHAHLFGIVPLLNLPKFALQLCGASLLLGNQIGLFGE